jgi:hypothetical protein
MTQLVNASFIGSLQTREKVARLEQELEKLPQTFVEPRHDIHGGLYARTGLIPAGTTFTGATHKKDHINVVCGDITVLTDEGPVRLTGYHVLPTQAGSKRVAYAHADTVWTTVVRTDLCDVGEIENECVEDSAALQTRKERD